MKFSTARISSNIFSLTVGQALNLLLNFVSIIFAARYLGVEDFGVFSYLLATVFILSKIIDFGLSPIIFREYSKDSSNFSKINNGITLRLVLFFIVIAFYNIIGLILSFSENQFLISNILFIGVILSSKFQNFRDILEIPFKVDLKMHLPMLLAILDNLILLILILLMPSLKAGLLYFVSAYIFSNAAGFFGILFSLNKKYGYRISLASSEIKWLIQESFPLFGFVIFSVAFQQIDVIMLKYLDSDFAAGIYAAATRLSFPLNILPTAIVSTVFPIIVSNLKSDPPKNDRIFLMVFKFLFIAAFSIAAVFSFQPEEIVRVILGKQYLQSAAPLVYLLWAQVFLFINFFALDVFTAYNKQKFNFYYSVIIVAISVVFNMIFIPYLSFNAPAYAKFVSGLISFIAVLFMVKQIGLSVEFSLWKILLWIFTVMVLIYLVSFLNVFIYLALALLILLLLTLYLKIFSLEEIRFILKVFNLESFNEKLKWFYNKNEQSR
ncbi:MAG: oligosaccharide flippase family protein [Ignavibacteriaceae bacterium]|nr:oligosaccharide flippase family protein [Ignavibacteriaceae bacterium]